MADVIVNHMSCDSPQFRDFIAHAEASPQAGLFLTRDKVFPAGLTDADAAAIYRPRPGLPFTPVRLANGESRTLWALEKPVVQALLAPIRRRNTHPSSGGDFALEDAGDGDGRLTLGWTSGEHNARLKIYSEPGHGTTIKVYLPRLPGTEADPDESATEAGMPLGESQEVVLVVEDEPAVRQFSVDALTELGYRVLEADGAASALRLLDAHPEIALLFTDVEMPEVNGARLAKEALRRRPGLRVLFTTGYTRNAVVHNRVLDAGVELIGKPFTIEELAAKVRAVLDGPPMQDRRLSDRGDGGDAPG